MALVAALAAIAGALCVRFISKPLLAALIPLCLVGIAVFFACAKKLRNEDGVARISLPVFAAFVCPVIGFYDGVFGPGAGAFYMIGFVSLLGYGVTKATGHTKLANAASNVGSLALFAATGAVVWVLGLVMAVGAFIGGQIGARLAIWLGAALIRPLLVVICCCMATKLLLDPSNALRQWLIGFF